MPRDDSNDRIKLRNDLDIELWDRNLKITMIKVLKELVEKVGNLHKQVGNSPVMEMLELKTMKNTFLWTH